jgi:hypothetical protein
MIKILRHTQTWQFFQKKAKKKNKNLAFILSVNNLAILQLMNSQSSTDYLE